ncbi:MAG: hypothetical protein AAF646_13260 [Pseudomonadota bacterium]
MADLSLTRSGPMPSAFRQRHSVRLRFILCIGLFLNGCAQFPELDRAITPEGQAAPAPELAPLDPLLAPADTSQAGIVDLTDVNAAVTGRAAATRQTAEALAAQQSQDPETRARLAARRAVLAEERATGMP